MSSSCVDNIGYKAAEYYKTIQIINGLQNQIQTLQQELFKLKGSVVEGIQKELTDFKTSVNTRITALEDFDKEVASGLKTLSLNGDIQGSNISDAFPTLIQ